MYQVAISELNNSITDWRRTKAEAEQSNDSARASECQSHIDELERAVVVLKNKRLQKKRGVLIGEKRVRVSPPQEKIIQRLIDAGGQIPVRGKDCPTVVALTKIGVVSWEPHEDITSRVERANNLHPEDINLRVERVDNPYRLLVTLSPNVTFE